MEPEESVLDWSARVQKMARELADLDEPVSDISIVSKVMNGVPAKYDHLVTSWDSVDPKRQTLVFLEEKLL